MEKALGRIFRAVKRELPAELAAAGKSLVQHVGLKSLADSEPFWQAQKAEFSKTVSGEVDALLQQGIEQGSRLGLALNFDLVNAEVLRFSAIYNDAWWNQLSQTTRNGLREAIQANIASGAPQRQLVKDITPLFGKARAQLIASTETTRLYAEGNMMAYRADPTVTMVEWMTVGDERVCRNICEPLADVYEKNAMSEYPPAHPACRCWLAPVVEGKAVVEAA